MSQECNDIYDVFVIGGGINGAGIARDAAGRGYAVAIAEMNDFASATSSCSTKLFHGGLRYLEFFKFRLVREALIEREVLLKTMPHISWPMRFVLPVYPDMRFDSHTPTSTLLAKMMPWMKGQRPRWLIRLGLFLYDHLGGLDILPKTTSIDLQSSVEGEVLEDKYKYAYEYSDCWVEDSRLTLLNIMDAQSKGSKIFARTKVTSAMQQEGIWKISLTQQQEAQADKEMVCSAKMIVNAGGPWVEEIIQNVTRVHSKERVRLVRGSHIVTRRLYEHDKCYFFQGMDGRIMFAIPYEEDYTLIGTTDEEHSNVSEKPVCTDEEMDYMLGFINQYFKKKVHREDIVWSFSGVRPLYDDGTDSVSEATRDYVQSLNTSAGAPVLNIFGGKITTYRKLAENALEKIDQVLSRQTQPWTVHSALPGGELAITDLDKLRSQLAEKMPFLDAFTIRRLVRQYGTQCMSIFAHIDGMPSLGQQFGHGVSAHEIDWGIEHEWLCSAEDFLWRRSKMGLRFSAQQAATLDTYIKETMTRHANARMRKDSSIG